MNQKLNLDNFADTLIKQKKLIQAIQYLLIVGFISLVIGISLSLPLRYYLGMTFEFPIIILIVVLLLSFIYGFLGIENRLEILKETDERMKLNEKLSAAYQFGESDNPYSKLLLSDSEIITEKLKVNEVFHVKYSRRDPFQPLLLALFLFLWMSSFSFLEITDENRAIGDILTDASAKIDAANSDVQDKDIEDIAEEYEKLGQKIQDQFMNDQSIKDEIDKLSMKLERKIEELSRQGVDKESQAMDEDDSEEYQLRRKSEMNDELSDILQSLMKTFSISPDASSGRIRRGEGDASGEGEQQSALASEDVQNENNNEDSNGDKNAETVPVEGNSELEQGSEEELQENLNEGTSESTESNSKDVKKDDEASGSKPNPSPSKELEEDDMSNNMTPGTDIPEDSEDFTPLKEEKQSGEFDEENIRGELKDGEQMKSFIRALPDIVEPTLEDREIIYFYKNQLETAMDREILPEAYESVVRDYFLSIGVLNE